MQRKERMGVTGRLPVPESHSFGERLVGAALLRVHVIEEIEADRSATRQAALVVCLSAAAVAIAESRTGLAAVAGGVFAELLGWLVWSGITYVIGDRMLGGTATWGELQRTIGFAQAPGLLSMLRIVPVLNVPVLHLVRLWKLVAVIVAIRQALDFGTGKALLTALLGFCAYVGIALGLMLLIGSMAPL
jgi:hypothetical protein